MVTVLSLPLVTGIHVFRNFDLFTLIQFSKLSKTCKLRVQSANFRVSKLEIYCSEESEISIEFHGNTYKFRLIRDEKTEERLTENPKIRDFHFKSQEDGIRILGEQLLELFRGSIAIVRLSDEFRRIQTYFQWERIGECPSVTVEKSEISAEELEFLSQRHLNSLNLKKLPEDIDSFRFNARNLILNDGRLLNRSSLLKIESENILILRSSFTSSDLNAFVRKWLEGDEKITSLSIYETEKQADFLEEIEVIAWDPKRRSRHFVKEIGESTVLIDCRNGMDLERKDGKIATILADHGSEFHFFVWHHKFPKVPENAFGFCKTSIRNKD